jgi:hypothetical protein
MVGCGLLTLAGSFGFAKTGGYVLTRRQG